jgi:hypothetical protein
LIGGVAPAKENYPMKLPTLAVVGGASVMTMLARGSSYAVTRQQPANRTKLARGEFRQYRRNKIADPRPYEPGESMDGVSISAADKEAGSPKQGDMIARNLENHADKWLVSEKYFTDNFEPA